MAGPAARALSLLLLLLLLGWCLLMRLRQVAPSCALRLRPPLRALRVAWLQRRLGHAVHAVLDDLDNEGCILLAASLRQHGAPKLRVLSLGHSLGDSGGAALAAALRGGGVPSLREISLSSSHLAGVGVGTDAGVGDTTCIELAAAVADLPELREIRLSYGCVGDAGAAALAAALASDAKPRHLEALWLGGNAIGDVGACALAKTLEPRPGGSRPSTHTHPNPNPTQPRVLEEGLALAPVAPVAHAPVAPVAPVAHAPVAPVAHAPVATMLALALCR